MEKREILLEKERAQNLSMNSTSTSTSRQQVVPQNNPSKNKPKTPKKEQL